MDEENGVLTNFDFPREQPAIIKVIGVGGGGGNAVTHMYKEGIQDVTFMLCNTDNQALIKSSVPTKLQLGEKITQGLGAGNKPDVAKLAAEESIADIHKALDDGTKMVFVTAGMGGGTGTGSAPIVAKVAKEMGILTVGIVTIPFLFEGRPKIVQAINGVIKISRNVDSLSIINNEKLFNNYGNLDVIDAFKKADNTLTDAARGIAEIITIAGHVNLDFADVKTTLKDGGVAIMSSGFGEGEGRVSMAFEDALHSPLLNNNDVFNAKKILFNVYFGDSNKLKMDEMSEVTNFMAKFDKGIEVIWGTATDNTLGENIKITILASGFGVESIPMIEEAIEEEKKLTEEENIQKEIEKEKLRKEKEDEDRKMDAIVAGIYGEKGASSIGQAKPKPFIFTIEQMDNNEIIEAIIDNPTYNRKPQLMPEILKKADARHAVSEIEN